jgi:hypothetical protein
LLSQRQKPKKKLKQRQVSQLTLKVLHQRLLPKQTKRLLLSLPQLQPSNFELDDEGYDYESDIELHRSYSRPRLVEVDLDNDEVSDYVAMRLARARERAMQAYYEKWA